jgi:hypothetical protein
VYNGLDHEGPRKLNCENFEDWPSAKIGPHKKFPLYGYCIKYVFHNSVEGVAVNL